MQSNRKCNDYILKANFKKFKCFILLFAKAIGGSKTCFVLNKWSDIRNPCDQTQSKGSLISSVLNTIALLHFKHTVCLL